LGLDSGAPAAVPRIGEVLMLIPEQDRFKRLCESIASVFAERQITPASLLETLPAARERVFTRRYPEVRKPDGGAKPIESGKARPAFPRLQRPDSWNPFHMGTRQSGPVVVRCSNLPACSG